MRKNILHFASHKGTEVYAILGSLVESCKMKGAVGTAVSGKGDSGD